MNEIGNEWELMAWRFVAGKVNIVVGRQKGIKWLWKSSITKEV